jgi:hypothetical protein
VQLVLLVESSFPYLAQLVKTYSLYPKTSSSPVQEFPVFLYLKELLFYQTHQVSVSGFLLIEKSKALEISKQLGNHSLVSNRLTLLVHQAFGGYGSIFHSKQETMVAEPA